MHERHAGPAPSQPKTVLRLGVAALVFALLFAVPALLLPYLGWAGVIEDGSWLDLEMPSLPVLLLLWLLALGLGVRTCSLAGKLHRYLREQEAKDAELLMPGPLPSALRVGWTLGILALLGSAGSIIVFVALLVGLSG